jgi:transcription initiation factor IIE alpha subunit|tara:strand:+ start:1325 stop:1594 length:270 start_codon:yes stop_codon:yes gene_type:complete
MNKITREMKSWLKENKDTASMEELKLKSEMMCEAYNHYTSPYRNTMAQVDEAIKKKRQNEIKNCVHVYECESGYHNERYYICKKCGHEK